MEFYETDELGGQTDNWYGPSLPCLLALCRTAGFARVEIQNVFEFSACVACYRSWLPPEPGAGPGPELLSAHHNMNYGVNFDSRFDESVTCCFRSFSIKLERDDVKPEVAGCGVKPIKVEPGDGETWRAHFKLPPGLSAGWHDVRVRLGNSLPSNEKRIAVDLPLQFAQIAIAAVADGCTWKANELNLSTGDVIAMWVQGLPENSDVNNVRAFLDDAPLSTVYVGPANLNSATQVNVQAPKDFPPGTAEIRVEIFGNCSATVEIEVLPYSAS
jgi:hypothetical protein